MPRVLDSTHGRLQAPPAEPPHSSKDLQQRLSHIRTSQLCCPHSHQPARPRSTETKPSAGDRHSLRGLDGRAEPLKHARHRPASRRMQPPIHIPAPMSQMARGLHPCACQQTLPWRAAAARPPMQVSTERQNTLSLTIAASLPQACCHPCVEGWQGWVAQSYENAVGQMCWPYSLARQNESLTHPVTIAFPSQSQAGEGCNLPPPHLIR